MCAEAHPAITGAQAVGCRAKSAVAAAEAAAENVAPADKLLLLPPPPPAHAVRLAAFMAALPDIAKGVASPAEAVATIAGKFELETQKDLHAALLLIHNLRGGRSKLQLLANLAYGVCTRAELDKHGEVGKILAPMCDRSPAGYSETTPMRLVPPYAATLRSLLSPQGYPQQDLVDVDMVAIDPLRFFSDNKAAFKPELQETLSAAVLAVLPTIKDSSGNTYATPKDMAAFVELDIVKRLFAIQSRASREKAELLEEDYRIAMESNKY
jgi:hypothetical protein